MSPPFFMRSDNTINWEQKRLAYDRNAVYMILSLAEEGPVLNAFHIEDGKVRKEIIEIVEEIVEVE